MDRDPANNSPDNVAIICPHCGAHILKARFDLECIWLLKRRGMNNAQIGRLLGISRERVRQLYARYKAKLISLSEANIDDLVRKAETIETYLINSGRLKKRTDKRTKRKRILAELNKLKGVNQNEDNNTTKRTDLCRD